MASNHRIRAILRLRGTIPKRQTDLLLALETFAPDDDGWREAGADLLDTEAGVSPRTAARAREELTEAGWLDYERGDGRGRVSRYRVRLPDVPTKEGRQNTGVKGRQNAGSQGSQDGYMATFKGRQQAPVKVANSPDKGRHRNPATSTDAIGALKESALKPSATRAPATDAQARGHARARQAADLDGRAEGARNRQGDDDDSSTSHPLDHAASDVHLILGGLTDDKRLIEFIIGWFENEESLRGEALASRLLQLISEGKADSLVRWARRALAEQDPAYARTLGPRRAPPCDDCGQPYSPAQLADDDFYAKAMAGTAGCIHEEPW